MNININSFLKKNSSTILTIIGSVGVGITAIVSARDTVRAIKRINYERGFHTRELNKKEKIKIAAPCYIPTVITGLSTILCVCGANKLNKNTQQSLATAYMLLDNSYKEYRKSVEETYGEEGELAVAKNLANKKIEELGPMNEDEDNAFFDLNSLQFFSSSLSKIREAEKAANEIMRTHGCVSLGTLYYMMGKDSTEYDELEGWSVGAGKLYGYDRVELDIQETTSKDGGKYYVVDFMDAPTDDYMQV